ncbi:MAG: DUF4157 domain-containing protein [Chloroflexi bacterium]|nr:DUF4157 domain-containing protein [Chloroflexota bacterium]
MAEHQPDVHRAQSKPPRKSDEAAAAPSTHPALKLQSLIGNQALQRLMTQGSTHLPGGTVLQAKLTVTSADNASEHEADSVAEQVLQRMDGMQRQEDEDELQTMRDPHVMREADEDELQTMRDLHVMRQADEDELQTKRDPNIVQRAEDEDEIQTQRDLNIVQRAEDEDKIQTQRDPHIMRQADEDEIQTKPAHSLAESFDVDAGVEQAIESQRGSGQTMSADVQRSFGEAFGADFSNVRIHTGTESDQLNAAVGARAFTTGSDVFFREGEYQPDTSEGKRLLAHELTHTIQQNAVSRKPKGK